MSREKGPGAGYPAPEKCHDSDRLRFTARITRHLMNLIKKGETVMVFTSKEKEVNTKPLILALFKAGNYRVVVRLLSGKTSASASRIFPGFFPISSPARLASPNLPPPP